MEEASKPNNFGPNRVKVKLSYPIYQPSESSVVLDSERNIFEDEENQGGPAPQVEPIHDIPEIKLPSAPIAKNTTKQEEISEIEEEPGNNEEIDLP